MMSTLAELQTLRSKIQKREDQDQTRAALFACDTKWIYDLWETCPEFKALDSWLTEDIDIPAPALHVVAQGCMSTGPTEVFPTTTAQLRRNSSMIIDNLRASKSPRPLTSSQSFYALPTTASCPTSCIPKRGVSLSRTQSLPAMLPPQAQARVLVALGTVTEGEEEG